MTIIVPRRRKSPKQGLPLRVSLAAWYRFRIGVTNISGKASAWADQSGNNRPLLQATAASRPTVQSDGSLLFDGADDLLQATFTLAQPYSIYLAFQQVTWTSGDLLFDGVTGNVRVAQNTSSPGLAANAGSGLTVSNTIPLNQRAVLAFVGNGASSAYQAAGGAATVTTSGNAGANTAGGLTLGASRTPGNWGNIIAYEFIAYSVAHTAEQRLGVMRYLGRIAAVGGIM